MHDEIVHLHISINVLIKLTFQVQSARYKYIVQVHKYSINLPTLMEYFQNLPTYKYVQQEFNWQPQLAH